MTKAMQVALLLTTALLFGANFTFMKVAAPAFGPLALIGLRLVLAAEVLMLVALVTRRRLAYPGRWWDWFVFAGLHAAIPFTLAAWAELSIPSSLAAIVMATMPLFTALFTAVWLRERLSGRVVRGMVLGLAGVAVLAGFDGVAAGNVLGVGAMVVAAASYALGAVYAKRRLASADPLSLTVGNCGAAGLLLLPATFATAPTQMPGAGAVAALAGLTLLGTVLAFGLYFRLLARTSAVTASATAFLIPAFGALLGTVFLHERLTPNMALGVALIVGSLVLVTGARSPNRPRPTLPALRWLRARRIQAP